MPGKFAKLKGKLDTWKPEPAYQEKVDEAKKAYIGLSPSEMAREFRLQENVKDECEQRIKVQNLEIEALSQLIVSALENSDLQAIELEGGMKCSLDIKPYVSVLATPQAQAAYNKWIHSAKIKPLLSLNAKTRDGFVKELLEAGKPAPAWAKVFLKTRAKITGKKNSNGNGEETE